MPADSRLELIRQAFEMARRSGKEDWARMTLPVLKNRLLTLTKGTLDHSAEGSFKEYVRKVGPPVRIDDSVRPPVAILESSEPHAQLARSDASPQVRPDLWRALLDYSSGHTYVWDSKDGIARLGSAMDGPVLPTVNKEEFSRWRNEFAERVATGDAHVDEGLHRWRDLGLPTASLPAKLRPLWNAEVRKRVVNRAHEWFEEQHIAFPSELVQSAPNNTDELQRLRQFVVQCVAVMTLRELQALSLPAAAMLRTRDTQGLQGAD